MTSAPPRHQLWTYWKVPDSLEKLPKARSQMESSSLSFRLTIELRLNSAESQEEGSGSRGDTLRSWTGRDSNEKKDSRSSSFMGRLPSTNRGNRLRVSRSHYRVSPRALPIMLADTFTKNFSRESMATT